MATVDPPIVGVDVYFYVWDVDDPFDQVHGPDAANPNDVIANVELMDNDTSGPDNRRSKPAVS